MINVAIVEDDREIRQTLALIIDGTPGFSCKNTFEDCESAIETLPEIVPDVVLMDINLPGMTGIEGIRILKERLSHIDFIMLTIQEDDESIFDSLLAGATGYLTKDTPPADLLNAIREVYKGGSPMSTQIARKVVTSFKSDKKSPLTERETEILQRLCNGENYKVIADAIFVSGHTVRAHIKNIYEKLHVHSRAEAVKKAFKDKLI
ncbi:response regulator transcription factor [Fulvivirgaceae bacterium BMA10]|uniref:Response regulator transcription factor n=1 Tax=Splendidivirga corallicola TaxID=3051826 RepID=A0ABT8KLJ2_9BACT|nr:response regulator transcription factor [Fulvivirgaceae bacterium BMA10]